MYRWYRDAKCCYVYMTDIPGDVGILGQASRVRPRADGVDPFDHDPWLFDSELLFQRSHGFSEAGERARKPISVRLEAHVLDF